MKNPAEACVVRTMYVITMLQNDTYFRSFHDYLTKENG